MHGMNRLLITTTIVSGLLFGGLPRSAQAQQQVTCQSFNDAYQFCPTSTHNGVQLLEELSFSPCIFNQTWGYRSNGIWVNDGCRANFQVIQTDYRNPYRPSQVRQGVTASQSPQYHNNNNDVSAGEVIGTLAVLGIAAALLSDNDDGGSRTGNTLTCSSIGNSYQYCPANTRGGVTLKRQLSSAGCWYQNSWGYDNSGVWVDNGCRAEFTLQ